MFNIYIHKIDGKILQCMSILISTHKREETTMENIWLFNVGSLTEGIVEKRPSQHCKTPYVADVRIGNNSVMGHTAALGCCGLVDAHANVYMIPVANKKNICPYRIIVAKHFERGKTFLIGVDPKMAESIVNICLERKLFKNLRFTSFEREKVFLNSRFDFTGVDEYGNRFIMEVKNVPLADYVDCTAKEKKNMNFDHCSVTDKVAYFPDGYRKSCKEPVSERALKHVKELKEIHTTHGIRTILCFVIQRYDISSFQPSVIDPFYRSAVQDAVAHGVELRTLVCRWNTSGDVHLVTEDLPISLF